MIDISAVRKQIYHSTLLSAVPEITVYSKYGFIGSRKV